MAPSFPNECLKTTTAAQKELDPPLSSLIQELREVDGCRYHRCVAIMTKAPYRCGNSYIYRRLWCQDDIHLLRNSEPPFTEAFATRLAQVLLCHAHRDETKHVNPLVLALTAKHTPHSDQSPDDGYRRNNSIQLAQAESSRRNRSKSAEPQQETSHIPPRPEPWTLLDVTMRLVNKKKEPRCIAFDGASGRCRCPVDRTKLNRYAAYLRRMCSDEVDDIEDDDFELLRRVIHFWLCEQHSHWFWLDFYHDLWTTEIKCDDESDESIEDESNKNTEREPDERVEDEPDESAEDESGKSADEKSHESVEECSSTESDSAVAAEESSDETTMSSSERRGPNSGPITINIAIQQNNFYGVPAQQCENGNIDRPPKSHSTPQTPQSLHNVAQGVLPASVLRLLPETRSPGVSEVPVRSTTPIQNGSQRATPNRGTTPTLDGLVAGVSRLDLKDSPLESKRKPREAKNDAESLDSPFDVFIKRLVRKLEQSLAKQLGERLSNKIELSCIYVFTSTEKPGLVKIGYADDPERRIKDIKKLCKISNLTMEHLAEDVPHFKQVENLIRCQLDPLKNKWECEPEKKRKHREWFRCEPDFAAEVVNTWADWMKEEPYAHGVLREKWAARVYEELERDKQDRKDEVFVDMIARHRRLLEQP